MAGYYDEITGQYIDTGDDYGNYTGGGSGFGLLDNTSGTGSIGDYTTTQVFDDGSTLIMDLSGNVIGATPATDTGVGAGMGFDLSSAISRLGPAAFDKLKSAFTKPDGSTDWRSVASAAGGLYGLYQANKGQEKTGFQGKIPTYEAQRTRLELPEDPNRRPGQYGRRYFSDVVFAAPTPAQPPAEQPAEPPAEAVTQPETQPPADQSAGYAAGGLANLAKGKYLRGQTDGMADKIPARIGGKQEAALSHGEFVIPADVVSHLGNGNSDAGARRLYEMMDRIRKARTGTTKQGKQVNPNKFMPS